MWDRLQRNYEMFHDMQEPFAEKEWIRWCKVFEKEYDCYGHPNPTCETLFGSWAIALVCYCTSGELDFQEVYEWMMGPDGEPMDDADDGDECLGLRCIAHAFAISRGPGSENPEAWEWMQDGVNGQPCSARMPLPGRLHECIL